MTKKVDYSAVKSFLWRYVRVFLAGFLVCLATSIKEVDVLSAGGLWSLIWKPALVAGVEAVAKALRDKFTALRNLPI